MLLACFFVKFGSMLGIHDMNADNMTKKLEDTMPVIRQVSEQFKNPVCTTQTNHHMTQN